MAQLPMLRFIMFLIKQGKKLSLSGVVVLWLLLQILLWYILERHHQNSQNSHFNKNGSSDFLLSPSSVHRQQYRNASFTSNTHFSHQIKASRSKNNAPPNIHIVVSTDCTAYQHWQAILLYYSARRVQQPGSITRIASGCTIQQQHVIQEEWARIDPTGQRFRVHFAPSTALHGGNYKYSNKPGGILHWLQHHQDVEPLDDSTVVCLLDPDMILLKPITTELPSSSNNQQWKVQPRNSNKSNGNQIEYINSTTGIAQFLRISALEQQQQQHDTSGKTMPDYISTGNPAGQHFGVGGAWVQGMAANAKPAWKNFSKALVCGKGSPCTTTSRDEATHKYAVGPVYLATVADWKQIATTWWDYVPKVHGQYPYLLAEMYSLTMAVANLRLSFHLFSNYMVTGSDVNSPTEAWSWVDDHIQQLALQSTTSVSLAEQICTGADATTPPSWTQDPTMLALPSTIHYCQRYNLDISSSSSISNHDGSEEKSTTFLFAKRKIPHDVFSCTEQQTSRQSVVPFNTSELIVNASKQTTSWSVTDRRSLFALCHLGPILNWARQVYYKEVCDVQDDV